MRRRAKRKSLNMFVIIDILNSAYHGKGWLDLYKESGIIFKAGFIKYLSFCQDKGLVSRTEIKNKNTDRGISTKSVIYKTTSQGQTLLGILGG